ncbi:hypothetical protein CAPTEDRAFT_219403 [Capitella teleta]|uniref:Normal mucosa of esophagus-specific gene 1 protein n=1 Tax=Capitella teleta TaxID=283909 RepID=R7UWQ3_CAPTE|nr:hypothetical protein CAPTEDRAFT_219403 [Capitella teleta]|eukprot:ELU10744.1 hypothetical protein CAPTEDRAFT_219403 [Capitella teleta]
MPMGTKIPKQDHGYTRSIGFGMSGLKRFPELVPVSFFMGLGGVMVGGIIVYSMYQKGDVKINRMDDTAPWESVDASQAQKLVTIKQKWEKIPEVENLKKELSK